MTGPGIARCRASAVNHCQYSCAPAFLSNPNLAFPSLSIFPPTRMNTSVGTSSSPPPIHSLGIGIGISISHRAIITHQAISDERWGSPIEYSVRWTPAVPGESRVWPWRSHERWWCVSRRRGRAPSFSGVCPGETVSMSRCSSV